MISKYSTPFPSDELSQLLPGEVIGANELTDGVLQFLPVRETDDSKLVISKGAVGNIVVSMSNKEPFHASVLIPENADDVLTDERLQSFQQPLTMLNLEPFTMRSGEQYWIASGRNLSNPEVPRKVNIVWRSPHE